MPQTATKPTAAKAVTNGAHAARHVEPDGVGLFYIPIDHILPGPNVRAELGDLSELTASIRERGVLQPISVREAPQDGGKIFYELLMGHRRLAATKAIGSAKVIPAIVYRGPGPKLTELTLDQLVENLQRADLNPLEEARAYRLLLDAGLSQRQLGERLGIAQSSISHALRLLKLATPVQEQIASGALSASHAKAIASLPSDEQKELGRRIVEHGLSAHQVEAEISMAQRRASAEDRARDEARQLADATEAALAKKRGATKEAVRLHAYDGSLAKELTARGWQLFERMAYYGRPAGCDCLAFSVSRQYMGSNADRVALTDQCANQAHVDAANKAAAAEREKRAETLRAEAAAEDAQRQAETDAIVAHFAGGRWGTTDDWRCILATLWQEDPWEFPEIASRHLGEEELDGPDAYWTLAARLDQPALTREFAIWLADHAEGLQRAALLEAAAHTAKAKAKRS